MLGRFKPLGDKKSTWRKAREGHETVGCRTNPICTQARLHIVNECSEALNEAGPQPIEIGHFLRPSPLWGEGERQWTANFRSEQQCNPWICEGGANRCKALVCCSSGGSWALTHIHITRVALRPNVFFPCRHRANFCMVPFKRYACSVGVLLVACQQKKTKSGLNNCSWCEQIGPTTLCSLTRITIPHDCGVIGNFRRLVSLEAAWVQESHDTELWFGFMTIK